MMNRRKLFATAALGATALALGACSTAQIQQAQSVWNSVVTAIQTGVNTVAKYIPTVESIAQEAAALFGPAYESIITIGSAALNTVIAELVAAVNNLSPVASSKMRARLSAVAAGVPVSIGITPAGIQVAGYH